MNSTTKRVLTTIIAPPLLFALVFFLPHASYLALGILAMLVTIGGAHEMKTLIHGAHGTTVGMPALLPALLPLAQWVQNHCLPHVEVTFFTFILLSIILCTVELVIGKKDSYAASITRVANELLILVYPGLLITFIQRILVFSASGELLILFFLLIFGNDIFAYVFGIWLGKNNRGWASVSPNKSIAGLVGGILSAVVLGGVFLFYVPGLSGLLTPIRGIALSLVTAIVANIGDLIESAFKRSAKMKDSGTLIPGRGGLLDSIDSMLVAAPVFHLLLVLFGVQ
ncbi:MAG: phosphatidate cytidylyltransferase [Spirochaetales bacterium]|nr:phosphatidate cytidylyltransferase [Spirochaetales bacterium]